MSSNTIFGRRMLFPVLQKVDFLSDRRDSVIDELGVRLEIDRKVSRDSSELLGMMFQLICVSAEYFDDRFQMFFHSRYSERNHASRRDMLGWVVWMYWLSVSSVPLMAIAPFVQATRAGSAVG
jgi:hypothetical protein